MASERLKKIIEENKKVEKESPYNFCDRWCERCPHQTQDRCTLYQDELERKLTCIAHGRDEDDPEITEEVLRWQHEPAQEALEKLEEALGEEIEEIDLEAMDSPEFEKIKKHIRFVESHSLPKIAQSYHRKAWEFLEKIDFKKNPAASDLADDFEIIEWYHTLLPAKLQRALAGFHEPISEGDMSLHDVVAQLAVCKKAIHLSTESLRKLKGKYAEHQVLIIELIALLQNILGQIDTLEKSI